MITSSALLSRSPVVVAAGICLMFAASVPAYAQHAGLKPMPASSLQSGARLVPQPKPAVQPFQTTARNSFQGPQQQAVGEGLSQMAAPQWTQGVLPAGSRLSSALESYLRDRGWQLRWLIEEDYVIDVNLPMQGGDVIEAVTWLVNTYQVQSGLQGVVPRFSRGNQVVAIEMMSVRDGK